MIDYSTDDLVLLGFHDAGPEGSVAELGVPDLADAIEVGDDLSRRVDLLSALTALENEGLVERTNTGDSRNRYRLTDRGRRQAADLYESVADRSVVVRNGDDTEVPLAETDRFFEGAPVATALSRMTDEGVVYLDDGVEERFVDREGPFRDLTDAFETAATGSAETVLVRGEAGVGKTALVHEVAERVDAAHTSLVACQPSAEDPYGPFRELFDALPVEDPIAAADAVDPDEEEALSAQRRALFEDATDRLREAAADGPVFVFVDDLQWAGDGTVDLLAHLSEHLVDVPAVLVTAYRSEDVPEDHPTAALAERLPDARRIDLDPLSRADTADLVRAVLDTRDVPESFVALVYDHAGGNPLFVSETVRGLAEDGAVDPINDVYPADRDAIAVPDAVEVAIDRRLSTLPDEATDLLELASVVGTAVPRSLLASVSDLPADRLREYADAFVETRLWRPASEDDAYRFVSGAVRDAIYDRVYGSRRELLHGRVAEALAAEEGTNRHERIAYHFREAGDEERALDHYTAAGEAAEDVYAHRDAIDRYERALELARSLGQDDQVLDLLESIGMAHHLLGEYEAADRRFRYVFERATDDETRQRACRRRAELHLKRGEYDTAIEHATTGIEIDPESPEACRLYDPKGMAHLRQGDHEAARDAFERQRDLARDLDDPGLRGHARHDLGTLALFTGDFEAAIERLESALEFRQEAGSFERASTLNNLGIAHRRRGDLAAAIDRYETALESYRERNDEYHVAVTLANLSSVSAQRGDLETAIEYGERARDRSERIGDRMGVAISSANLGTYHRQRGDLEASLEYLEAALERFEDIGTPQHLAKTLVDVGTVHRARDALDRARECHRRAIDVATEAGLAEPEVSSRVALAKDLLAGDDFAGAADQIERAREFADEAGLEIRAEVALVAGQHRYQTDDYDAAIERFERAADLARQGSFPGSLARAHKHLGELHADREDHDAARDHLETSLETARENDLELIAEAAEDMLADL